MDQVRQQLARRIRTLRKDAGLTQAELGARAENRVEVVTGLTGDEQVIVSGKDLVSEGAAVQTQPMDTVKRES